MRHPTHSELLRPLVGLSERWGFKLGQHGSKSQRRLKP
jgi:hypothetical protein